MNDKKPIFEIQVLLNPQLHDLNPVSAGWATNISDTPYGPFIRDYTIIHYVRSGCGTVQENGVVHHVHAGQAFIICPGQNSIYTADHNDPWSYQWVQFTGSLSSEFSALPPVFDVPEDMFCTLRTLHERINHDTRSDKGDLAYRLASDLLIFYANILRSTPTKTDYIQYILDYVYLFYKNKISIEALSVELGLDRSYLSRQFKKKIGCSIQDHILNVRLTQGRRYLALGYSVAETAELCGYSSATIFYKLFKKQYGESPREWKKRKDAINKAHTDKTLKGDLPLPALQLPSNVKE